MIKKPRASNFLLRANCGTRAMVRHLYFDDNQSKNTIYAITDDSENVGKNTTTTSIHEAFYRVL
jgi:hypothetical protein